MTAEDPRSRATAEVGQQHVAAGGVGVQLRVDGLTQRHSTIPSTAGDFKFTRREAELAAIQSQFEGERVVVLHGAPGLGKSRLAKEFARRHAAAYPGGMFLVPFEKPPPAALARLLRNTDRPAYPDELHDDQCRRALGMIGRTGRALLIYDAIADEHTLLDWMPYEGLDWHLLVTSTSARWNTSWNTLEVSPLQSDAARELAASILGEHAASERLAGLIAANAAGVTIHLCNSAEATREQLRRGRSVAGVSDELARETRSSFDAAWTLLFPEAQLVLRVASTFATSLVPISLVVSALERTGWTSRAVQDALDEVSDRKLARATGDILEVHQLVARFARDREPLDESVQQSLFQGLLAAARAFSEQPGDLDRRGLLLAHSLHVDDWKTRVGRSFEWHVVGNAVADSGRFAEALPWFERAVAAKEQGDVHGRVDSASLGSSLHQVGYCYGSLGQFAEAQPWFERAVAAAEKGNVHGRVDSASLGSSLHVMGYCYSSLGQFAEALPWYERAVAAAEKGDVHGRVDSASLGSSLHQVGYCYWGLDQFAEALPWFERAVAAKEQGDVLGRVDSESLGTSLAQVGYCYSSRGQFGEALPWFERAAAAKEKGDVHGRVDWESLGTSLHLVGECHASRDLFTEALPWFERAVGAAEKGDVHGRVDSESLGKSLHHVGECHASRGEFVEALPWFERAIAAKEKGDVHGRVNSESLGSSLHQVGYCHARRGQFAEALPWFERAIAAKEKGDVHGRVDSESLEVTRQARDRALDASVEK